jgi:hypothetical protein
MNSLQIIVSTLGYAPAPLSPIEPFAVLLDASDPEWANSSWLKQKIAELLNARCCYFVCYGPDSELFHDQIDDIIIDNGYGGLVSTTFHSDEPALDVVAFFKTIIANGTMRGLVLVHDAAKWNPYFEHDDP